MLNLPNQAFIDKFLPKKSFEEKVVNGKKVFKDISKITLKYKLAPNTINIEASENIKEILIFELILNEKNMFMSVGSQHLMYECGMVTQLKKLGYKLTPIDMKTGKDLPFDKK